MTDQQAELVHGPHPPPPLGGLGQVKPAFQHSSHVDGQLACAHHLPALYISSLLSLNKSVPVLSWLWSDSLPPQIHTSSFNPFFQVITTLTKVNNITIINPQPATQSYDTLFLNGRNVCRHDPGSGGHGSPVRLQLRLLATRLRRHHRELPRLRQQAWWHGHLERMRRIRIRIRIC